MIRWLLLACLIASAAFAQGGKNYYPPQVSSLKSSDIADFDANPPAVKILLESALALTRRNLGYLYGSNDPVAKGMDCSGTVYYLLRQAGVEEVPRSSAEQFAWVVRAGTIKRTSATSLDSPEFAALRPGDLLFWSGTYAAKNSSNGVTHAMIYLGRAKSDGAWLMVGASDGRTYRGQKRFGVSVFDFILPRGGSKARFIGYGPIPGLGKKGS